MGACIIGLARRARHILVLLAALLAVFGILGSTASLAQSGRLLQLSTRAQVLTGEDVMIAGFIIGGSTPKTVVINVAGPSQASLLALPLRNPTLMLVRQSDKAVLKTNDNWQVQDDPADVPAIVASGFQPNDGLEPAIIATLPPGAYTAIVHGAGEGTGVAVVGVWEVDHPEVPLINISTRAKVLTGENVVIAGFAVGPADPLAVVISVAGPSLVAQGVANPLQNPALSLVRMSDQAVIATNDDWQIQANPADVAALQASGLQPNDPREPAIIATLAPGLYTAIASGVGADTGIALASVFRASRDVAITSANNTTFTVGTAGTFTVTTAGTPAATSVTATGALPNGVTFTPGTDTGTLSGTPAAGTGGTYNLTITASNGGITPNGTQTFTLTVNEAPAITSVNAATFQVGSPNIHTVVATGFPVPTVSMAGALPAGVTFDAATGVLSGIPTVAGSFPLVFTAANGVGANAAQNFTLTVNQTVEITSASAATFTVGTADTFTITTSAAPTATSITTTPLPAGLSLSATSPTGTATISGTPLGPSGVFTITITASNGGVTPNGTQTFTLTVLGQAQTISFTSAAPASPVANGPTYNVTATATSGLTVALTIDASASSVCTIAGSTVTFIAGGTCVINANQAGNGNYAAAPQVQQSMVVAKATQTVTITTPAPGAAVVAGPAYNVAATATSGLPVTFSTSTPAVCSAAGSTISFIGAGTCTVVASQAGNATYDPAQATQSFAVAKASQTISFTSVAPTLATVGGATYGVTATATSGLAVAFTIDPAAAAVCSIAGSTVSFIGAGNCIVNANQAGNANYNAAPQVQQVFAVKNSQTITFTSTPTNPAVGGPTYTPTATATSGLAVAITIDPSAAAVCSIAGGVVTFNTVGTCVINANQAGNASYYAAPQVQQSFAVNQVPAITSANNTTFNVGTPGTFTVTTTGFPTPTLGATGTLPGGVTFVDNGNGTATLSGTPAAGSAAGSPYGLTITAANGVPPNATQPFTLTVVDPAVANNDAFGLQHDTVLNVPAPGFLGNDTGSPAPTVTSVTGTGGPCVAFPCIISTANGSATIQANGAFTFTPDAGFIGVNTFTYVATNSGGSSGASVTLGVDNQPPSVDLDGSATGGIDFGPVAFTEGGGAVVIVGATNPNWLTIIDDEVNAAGATVVLTNLQDVGAETLAVTCPMGPAPACSGAIQTTDIVSTAAAGSFTITITRVAPRADYEALLRTLTYDNASQNPTAAPTRIVTVAVSDGFSVQTPLPQATVTVAPVNDAPVLAGIEAGALAYSISAPPTAITSTLTVTDADSATLASATVQITANCVNADDVLSFTPQNGISGVYSAVTCTMTLSGSSSPANYQTALRDVRFQNTNAATSNAPRTVSFQANDGAGANNFSNIVTRTVNLQLNTAPALTAGGTLNYTENQAPTAIDTTVAVSDIDSPNLIGATVQITTNCTSTEDVLSFTTQNGITGTYAAGTCTMTLTGSSSVANYQAALRSVAYHNSSEAPSTLARAVTWQVNDGGGANNLSNTPTSTINVAAANDGPVLTAGATLAYTENDPAAVIDATVTVTDPDSTDLTGATVQITANCNNPQDVLAFTNQNGISGVYTPATCLMTLTGTTTLANYQTALRSITYVNTSENPSAAPRTVTWIGTDGTTPSTGVTSTINVTAVNDAPVLAVVGSLAYTENQAAASLITSATITDPDSTNMTGATVQITGNYVNGQDVLSYVTALGITGSFSAASGTLTLTGTTTIANYQTALANVKYANTSENPSTAMRTVTWQVNDGGAANNLSNQPTSTFTVTAVNDAPTAASFAGQPAQAGIPITYPAGKLSGTDPEGTAITINTTPVSVTNGTVTINADGSFVFTPSPAAATASFQYTVTDSGSPTPNQTSAPATVSFTVAGPPIFFVKSTGSGTACTLGNECLFATAATNSAAVPTATIFISDAASHAGGTLGNGVDVVGQGVTGTDFDTLFGILAPAQGTLAIRPLINQARPSLTSAAAANTLTLGSGNSLMGFNLGNTNAGGTALGGASIGALTVSQVAVTSSGAALNLANGTGTVTFDSVSSSGGATGVSLTGVGGNFALGTGALAGNTTTALALATSSATITYAGDLNPAAGGRPVDIGTAALSSGLTGGTVTLSGRIGNSPAASNAIRMRNSTGGTINFAGTQQTLSTGANNGVELTTNPGATITFSGGNLDIATTSGAGFTATGGGTVSVTGGSNSIGSGTGAALTVTSTTIGAGGLNFVSIASSGGSANGITLDTTGTTAGLTVTGDGANTAVGGNGTGGTIANKSGADFSTTQGSGIYLNNTKNVVLRRMIVNGTNQNFGIRGTLVDGFTLEYSTVNGTQGNAASLAFPENAGEGAIYFGNVTTNGIANSGTFTNNVIGGAAARNISLIHTAGSATLTIKGNTFQLNQATGNQALLIEARNAGTNVTATVGGTVAGEPNTFAGAPGDNVNFTGQTGTTMTVTMRNNTLTNSHPNNNIGGGGLTLATQGTMNFIVDGNIIRGADGSAVTLFKASAATLMSGVFSNNQIGQSGVLNSGSKSGNGIFVSAGGTGTMSYTITNNQIRQYAGNAGIFADNTGGSYTANFTVTGNLTAEPGATSFAGLAITNGSPASTDTVQVCADIKNNDFSLGDPTNSNDIIVGASGAAAGHTFVLPGYVGSTEANVQTFIRNNNLIPASTAVTAYVDAPVTPASFVGTGTSCPTP